MGRQRGVSGRNLTKKLIAGETRAYDSRLNTASRLFGN